MVHKYKLKEIEVGDVKVDNGVKSVVTDKDPNTGAISWSIDYVPNLTKLVEDSMELANTAKGVYQKAKDDKKFLDIYEQAKQLRNTIRTHVRNNYPEDYKKAIFEEDVDEISMSGAAGAYNTPYAFRKKGSKPDDEAYKELGYKVVKEKALPVVRKKLAKVPKAKKVASKYRMKMPSGVVSSLGYTMGEGTLGDGADLGPGPKAGPEGVTNNAYTNQFKYKLVPKNKDGTYVQKGAGMIVKKLY
ncbi:hypothetical protein N9H34_00700 [bacterium]|jgi:hypothetical protein|nr:hypothetical protein [bacterium]